jgi:PAS domain S-box-containing protein
MIIIILALSISLQIAAAIIAIRLIRITGKYSAWSLIAASLLLMAFRRIIPFWHILSGDPSFQPDLINESVGLLLTILILAGIIRIGPLFTATKLSEKQARDAEEKYRNLFNNATDGIYLTEYSSNRILDCNKKALEMIGYTREELQSLTFLDLYLSNERDTLRAKLKALENSGSLHEITDLYHKKKDGSLTAIELSATMIEIKGEKLILSFIRDISERKRDEEKIRLFQQATDSSNEAIGFANLDKRIIYVNSSFEKMFGYTKDELIGKKIEIVYPEDSNNKLQQAISKTLNGGWIGELTGKRKDGTLFPISVSSSRILNEKGSIIARMAYHRDITEIKRAEEKMIEYTEQLRSLSDHLATIREEERLNLSREIHDGFGSSLTGLKMELMMHKRQILDCQGTDIKQELLENIQSMSDMIDSTIGLMRKLATELRPGILDELGLVEAIRWYINETEKKSNIKFRFSVFPRNIITDAKLATTLFRIFQEILTNITRHSKATEVTVFLKKQNNLITFLIRDNGIGIKDEELKSKKSLGILGMQERATIFGGKLEIEGIEGKGTVVKVEIPVNK